MTGSPIPYFFGNDNLLQLLFLLDILGIAYVFVLNGNSILQRIKSLFYYSRNSKPYNNQTHINRLCNIILYGQVIFVLSLLAFAQAQYDHGILYSKKTYIYWGVYIGLFSCMLIFKRVSYDIVNNILFTTQQKREWRNSYFFTLQLLGFILLPLVATFIILPNVPQQTYTTYLTITALICLLMLIKQCKKIIFTKKTSFLDIILYLCTLEIIPIAIFIKAIKEFNLFLTINF
ncbi:MAG: DUF4271 domain-containing protein [Bacteroidaceae bacterium]|nr:DUF4271 domain-containing protein [Bacteroidaceae bacterium]